MPTVKALTLHEPWAMLAVTGEKGPETRSWQTKHRGRLAIHAGLDERACRTWPGPYLGARHNSPDGFGGHRYALLGAGLDRGPLPLPLGYIVGSAELIDCAPIGSTHSFRTGIVQGDEGDWPGRHVVVVHNLGSSEPWSVVLDPPSGGPVDLTPYVPFGDYTPGRFAWILSDPKPTTARCPACWDVPPTVAAGVCVDIDGQWWHTPGSCPYCRGACPVCVGGTRRVDPIRATGHQGVWDWNPAESVAA